MADLGNNKGSFDVEKELEAILKDLNSDSNRANNSSAAGAPLKSTQAPRQQAQAQRRTQTPTQRPQAPVQRQQAPVQQKPAEPQQPMGINMTNKQRSEQKKQHQGLTSKLPFLQNITKPKTRITTTTKNGMKIYEDKTDYSRIDDSNASYYDGEVYFSSKKPVAQPALVEGEMVKKRRVPKNKFEKFFFDIADIIQQGGKKGNAVYLSILLVISIILSAISMSLLGDILAFNRSDEVVAITVEENATTNKIITQLDKKGLVKHGWFCKMFMGMTKGVHEKFGPPKYLSGVYYLSADMCVEKMLYACQDVKVDDVVTVTIPEGFTIEQIAIKLEKSGVCQSHDFYRNLEAASFNYPFIKDIDQKKSRYQYLEGYLYPDTYEFFLGQNASSVINKLFENFDDKWSPKYDKRAKELGMSVDDVITLASIVQREAADAEQMPVVAAIFHNRLKSNDFPSLQSDATNVYVNKFIKPNVDTGEYGLYWANYSTYECRGLPVGPICSPGDEAIKAVLWPASTDAYYFCHDKAGNIYTAKTELEHQNNYSKAMFGDKDSDE